MCKYILRVCIPTLCVPLHPPLPAEPAAAAAEAPPVDMAETVVEAGSPAPFYGLMWGAVLDGGNDVAQELIAPRHYATGATTVHFGLRVPCVILLRH